MKTIELFVKKAWKYNLILNFYWMDEYHRLNIEITKFWWFVKIICWNKKLLLILSESYSFVIENMSSHDN